MRIKIQQVGIYETLVSQLDRIFRHNRQGSFHTKRRYYEAMKRFCAYLADVYHLQKLSNISGKHLVSYVIYLQDTGKSASTIKTDLAAIRFFHDKMDHKYTLPSNDELGITLERRRFGQDDRTWSMTEFNKMLGKALAIDRYDFILALYLARYAGLRIHECFRIDTATAERALRENAITIKGKGGKVRTVPINEQIAIAMRKQLERTPRGHKLLVPDDMPTDRAINYLQFFIMKHRDEVRDVDSDRPMTFHGLRHTYAAEKYQELINNGKSPLDAHFEVSRLLGHERPDVTNIYLASVRKETRDEHYYFQFTLNAYGKDVEPNVPSKNDTMIPSFIRLSKAVGRDRVIWRYDPIFLNADYTMEYHCKYFKRLAAMLSEYTEKCTVSFIDLYKNTARNVQPLQIQVETHEQQLELLSSFSEIAHHYGIFIDTCAEAIELNGLKIPHACCIDKDRLERLGHCKLKVEKDKNQRPECGCVASIDIGAYNTCKNGCLYCYANYSGKTVKNNSEKHNPNSPLLFGEVGENDTVLERKVKSWKIAQQSLFD